MRKSIFVSLFELLLQEVHWKFDFNTFVDALRDKYNGIIMYFVY